MIAGTKKLRNYPRGTDQLLIVDPSCYEGDATETVALPRPLGRMSRKLKELSASPVQLRSIGIYAQLAEVIRLGRFFLFLPRGMILRG